MILTSCDIKQLSLYFQHLAKFSKKMVPKIFKYKRRSKTAKKNKFEFTVSLKKVKTENKKIASIKGTQDFKLIHWQRLSLISLFALFYKSGYIEKIKGGLLICLGCSMNNLWGWQKIYLEFALFSQMDQLQHKAQTYRDVLHATASSVVVQAR